MALMKDSTINEQLLRENMRLNPPALLPDGKIFSGPVRLSFANIFKPSAPNRQAAGDSTEPKYGSTLLFPPGTDMSVFNTEWFRVARESFPKHFDANGNPQGLHSPFHDQGEKAVGAKPYAGYTPGAIALAATSKFKPAVVDLSQNLIVDEDEIYSGVWAFVSLNSYSYNNRKMGVAFGLMSVMKFADDQKLAGGGGDPKKDFAAVQITAQSNVAAKFNTGAAPGIMPGGGHQGQTGALPVQPLPNDLM